ncbi:hypothetical protein Glove_153g27 [Diversispora epigaea]|uniref:Uncharacterized protein n=1 Tax=Diversispora epigaea TaxID=1348612 RepID=A0A397J1L2_9GLOM|nr:hypothetical protein Glove_153g27 [Diversispora epigaea]
MVGHGNCFRTSSSRRVNRVYVNSEMEEMAKKILQKLDQIDQKLEEINNQVVGMSNRLEGIKKLIPKKNIWKNSSKKLKKV